MRISDLRPALFVLGLAFVLFVILSPGPLARLRILGAAAFGALLAATWLARRSRGPGGRGERRAGDGGERDAEGAGPVASRALLAGILDLAMDAVISVNEAQRIEFFNPGAERIFGYSAAEVLGQPLDVLLPERFAAAHHVLVASFGGSPEIMRRMDARPEITGRRKNGSEFPAEASISRLEIGAKKTYNVVLRDVTARKRAEGEIRRLNASLERQVAERTAELRATIEDLEAFSYSVSHDLRAPLRAIDGFAAALEQECAPHLESGARRYLEIIRSSALRMGQLIDDLLAFSRLGRQRLAPGRIDMRRLVESVIEDLKTANPGREMRFRIGDLPPASGDAATMRQVFYNLLSNAVKFSKARAVAEIEVGARLEGDRTIYSVEDHGVGFDMQYASRLFGVFQRLHSAQEFEGTGVGLAIVERIVRRHGGRVWAEAQPGVGATFHVELPNDAGSGASGAPPAARPDPESAPGGI